jgi:predicted membrane-bound spermidine synthase
MTRPLALLLTLLTGFTGLVYEVTWQKYLAILLGSHSEATAAVLAIFLGGLSLGYALFGGLTSWLVRGAEASARPPRLLAFYGGVEAAIGAWAFVFPLLFRGAQALSLWIPVGNETLGFGFDVLLAALLIGPPAVLMGATIPALTQALAKSLADATRFHAFVYAFNTAGAFAGALAAGFWLVPALGLVGVLRAMGAVNVLAGAGFLALGSRARATAPGPARAAPVPAPAIERFALYALVAGLNGYALMAIQTVLIRLGGLAFGSSHFTFAMVVAVFVLCIALGSFAVSLLPRIRPGVLVANQWALALCFFALYGPLQDFPYFAHALRSLFRDTPAGFYPYYGTAFAAVLLAVGLPVMLSGAALPLLFHHLRRQVGDLGGVAGRLYSFNTLGSLLGALLGGFVLYFWLDLHAVYRVAVAALLLAAAVISAGVLGGRWRVAAAALLIPTLLGLVMRTPWSPDRLASGVFRMREPTPASYAGPEAFFASLEKPEIVFYTDDPAVSIAVKEFPEIDGRPSRSIFNNGKSDGNIPEDYTTMALAALLPALIADRVERSFVIGYGTGVTVGELAALDSTREVVVAEISAGAVRAAPLFDYGNLGASGDPKVRIVRSDAYRALLRSRGVFDIIASEPSNPWVTGVEMLYSREFLAAARQRLAPGGVFAQWIHTYEIDAETLELVARTYASVFDAISVWYARGPDLILLGFADDRRAPDLARIAQRLSHPDIRAGFARAGISGLPALLAHELLPLGVVHALDLGGPVHTLLHPRLSHSAALAFYRGESGDRLHTSHLDAARIGHRNALIRRLASRQGGRLSRAAQRAFARETCKHRPRECAVVLARWHRDEPNSAERERLLARSRRRPTYREALSADTLTRLARLFSDGETAPKGPGGLAAAKRATELFVDYYHHAVPFERRALAAIWRACPDRSDELGCRKDRAVTESALGDLDAPL